MSSPASHMVDETRSDSRTGARERHWTAALVLVLALSTPWLVHPWYDLMEPDASMYIASARSLIAGEGYSYLGSAFHLRPPGLSFVIVPILLLRGNDFLTINLTMHVFGAAGILFLFWYLRRFMEPVVAFAVALFVWLLPAYRVLCNEVMSDIPGMTLVLASLLLACRAEERPTWMREILLGSVIGLATYMRTVGVLLLPAIWLSRVLLGWRSSAGALQFACGRFLICGAAAAVIMAPWVVFKSVTTQTSQEDQEGAYSYWTAVWHEEGWDPHSRVLTAGAVLHRVPEQVPKLLVRLTGPYFPTEPIRTRALIVGSLLAAALFSVALWRKRAGDLFALANGLVLSVWFTLPWRLTLPLVMFAIPAAVEVSLAIAKRIVKPRLAVALVTGLVAVTAALIFTPRPYWDGIRAVHEAYSACAHNLLPELGERARVGAPVGWHYSVYLKRPVYTLAFAVERSEDGLAAAERIVAKYDLDTLVFCGCDEHFETFFPPLARRYGGFARRGTAAIVRTPERFSRAGVGRGRAAEAP